jgi:hypothetical protein
MIPAEAGISKADISFRIGCEYRKALPYMGKLLKKTG